MRVYDQNTVQISEALLISFLKTSDQNFPPISQVNRMIESDRIARVPIQTFCEERSLFALQHGYSCKNVTVNQITELDLNLDPPQQSIPTKLSLEFNLDNPESNGEGQFEVNIPSTLALPETTQVFVYNRGNYEIITMQRTQRDSNILYSVPFIAGSDPSRWRTAMILPQCEMVYFTEEVIIDMPKNQ